MEDGIEVGPRLSLAGDIQKRRAHHNRRGLVVGTARAMVSISPATSLEAPDRAAPGKKGAACPCSFPGGEL
jgi:hypothetical protein